RPERDAVETLRAGRRGDEYGERVVGGDLERLAAERGARGGGGTHDELGELTYDVRLGLSGDKPALARHEAASRVARVLLAALDQRRVDGAGAEQRVTGLLLEAGRELPQPREHGPHGGDRVDAEIRPRAVCRPSRHLDLVRREPLVGDA